MVAEGERPTIGEEGEAELGGDKGASSWPAARKEEGVLAKTKLLERRRLRTLFINEIFFPPFATSSMSEELENVSFPLPPSLSSSVSVSPPLLGSAAEPGEFGAPSLLSSSWNASLSSTLERAFGDEERSGEGEGEGEAEEERRDGEEA